jgi:urease accessory protein
MLLTDAFLSHDPAGEGRPFGCYRSVVEVCAEDGRRLMIDRARIRGKDLAGPGAPQGEYTASASVYAFGLNENTLPPQALESALAGPGILCGASSLPNESGVGLRILADGGVSLSRALEKAFETVLTARFGVSPGKRRK